VTGRKLSGLPEDLGLGREVGLRLDDGTSCLNLWSCCRERESAIELSVPAMWAKRTVKLLFVAVITMKQTRCMMSGLCEVPDCQMRTTAWLSQWNRSFLWDQL
jgi:hypothetical protein